MNLEKLNLTLDNLDDYKEEKRIDIIRQLATKYGLVETELVWNKSEIYGKGLVFGFTQADINVFDWCLRFNTKNSFVEIAYKLIINNGKVCAYKFKNLSDIETIDKQLDFLIKKRKQLLQQIKFNQINEDFK